MKFVRKFFKHLHSKGLLAVLHLILALSGRSAGTTGVWEDVDECRLYDITEESICFHEKLVCLARETYTFLRDVVKPAFIHIFPYSRRAGTPAAERKDQVQDSKKTLRVQMLEELSDKLHAEFVEANKGVAEKVLFESTDRKGMMEGYTGNYIRISQPYDPELIGKIIDITI